MCGTLEKWEKPDVYWCTPEVFNIHHTAATWGHRNKWASGACLEVTPWPLPQASFSAPTGTVAVGTPEQKLKDREEIVLRERKNGPIFANPRAYLIYKKTEQPFSDEDESFLGGPGGGTHGEGSVEGCYREKARWAPLCVFSSFLEKYLHETV